MVMLIKNVSEPAKPLPMGYEIVSMCDFMVPHDMRKLLDYIGLLIQHMEQKYKR